MPYLAVLVATSTLPSAASRYQAASAAAARSCVVSATRLRGKPADVWSLVATYQTAQAQLAEQATTAMLDAQGVHAPPDAPLLTSSFTTSRSVMTAMLDQADVDWRFTQLVASLVQDAGRAAQSVSVASRPNVGYVRVLNGASCSRCAILAGRVYRYSEGFLRHPHDDCTMMPTGSGGSRFVQNPHDLLDRGLVTGLSRADRQAVADGADLAQVVNIRSSKAGLVESGRALSRRGRPTPEAIYRATPNREEALAALQRAGYLR